LRAPLAKYVLKGN